MPVTVTAVKGICPCSLLGPRSPLQRTFETTRTAWWPCRFFTAHLYSSLVHLRMYRVVLSSAQCRWGQSRTLFKRWRHRRTCPGRCQSRIHNIMRIWAPRASNRRKGGEGKQGSGYLPIIRDPGLTFGIFLADRTWLECQKKRSNQEPAPLLSPLFP